MSAQPTTAEHEHGGRIGRNGAQFFPAFPRAAPFMPWTWRGALVDCARVRISFAVGNCVRAKIRLRKSATRGAWPRRIWSLLGPYMV